MNNKKFILNAKIAALTSMMLVTSIPTINIMAKESVSNTAIDTGNDDWLHAKGSRLYDKDGNEVWMTGANWFGFNCSENVLHGIWSTELDDTLKAVADRGINLLRIPVSTELLYKWMNGDTEDKLNINWSINPDLINPDGTNMNSMEVFDQMMVMCKKYGIKVMVDVHSPDANNSGHFYELWYGKQMSDGTMVTTDMWIDTWVWLVEKYKNDDTLIAVDLKNEPHGKRGFTQEEPTNIAKWDDSTDEHNWKHAVERCSKAILEVNPNILIMVEGIESTPKSGYTYEDPDVWESADFYDGGWWGGNLRRVKDYPIDLGEHQSQLVYSPHDYGPLVYAQSWFNKDFTEETLLEDYWYDAWAYIEQENIAPLLMGEWGGTLDDGDNEKWLNILANYMTEHRINHTFWCLNPNSGDTGGLLYYDFKTWDENKYSILEPALWQNDAGTYIGLDHVIPLGENGITVSEHYGEAPEQKVPVESITLDKKEVTIQSGEEIRLIATVLPKTATNKEVKYVSSDEDVAVVDKNGNVKANNEGTAVITVITKDGNKTANTKIKVISSESEDKEEDKVTGIKLNKDSLVLKVGNKEKLIATVLPTTALNKKVKYASSDSKVASVDENGNVKAVSKGVAIITAITEEGNKKFTCTVTVQEDDITDPEDIQVTEVRVEKNSLEMTAGTSYTATATVKPNNASNKELSWKSQDTDIATVDEKGTINAIKEGNTTITVSTIDGKHSAQIRVNITSSDKVIKLNSMWLNTYWLQIKPQDTHQLVAYFSPENATNKNTTFKSSNEEVIKVDEKGVVTAVKEGSATVTTTSVDGDIKVVTQFVVSK